MKFSRTVMFSARVTEMLVELYFLLPQWWPANNLIFLQKNVAAKMDLLWKFLKPISFALIGKEVNFGKLDGTVVAYGFVIILLGSVVSLTDAYFFCFLWRWWTEKSYKGNNLLFYNEFLLKAFINISMNWMRTTTVKWTFYTLPKNHCANGTLPKLFLILLLRSVGLHYVGTNIYLLPMMLLLYIFIRV